MHNELIPVLVLLVGPALILAHRSGLARRPAVRWLGGGALVVAIVLHLPYAGMDFLYLKRIKLFLAAATALVLLGRSLGLFGLRRPGRFLAALSPIAILAVVVYFNFFAFHGARTFLHLHDVSHYYLGSKYYAEAGYHDLYTAMVRAEWEAFDGRVVTLTARDLHTYEEVEIVHLLDRSEGVKAAFTEERWEEFKKDVAFFRTALGEQYGTVLRDHGFNATPVWALFGSALSRRLAGGSERGLLALSLLDLVLLAALLAAIGWAFDLQTMLLALLSFVLIYGAGFGWNGGAFLRYLWFFCLMVGLCCLRKRLDTAAGALFATAALLRIFPIFFVVPIAFRALGFAWRKRRWPRRQITFFASFVATAILLVAATGLLPRGFEHWREFRTQMELHVANISPNVVGLTDALAFQRGAERQVTQEEFNALKLRRQRIHTAQLILLFVPMLLLAARLARYSTELGSVAMALPLLHASLSLASYYQVFLLVLVLWQRRSMTNLALFFAVEAASYSLMLFEDRDGLLFIYRSLLLLFLYAAFFARPIAHGLRGRPPAPASGSPEKVPTG